MAEIKFTSLFIDNQFVPSDSGKTFETINPSTGEVLAKVAEAQAEDVEIAVRSSRKAFESGWGESDGAYRTKLLLKLADLIDAHTEKLALLESLDNGMQIGLAAFAIGLATSTLRYCASFGEKLNGSQVPHPDHLIYTKLEPFGVCAGVLPWNFPITLTAWKLGPALITGNTIIIKPSEKTPLSTLYLAHLIAEAGFPPGVVNVLPGYGTVGAALASHNDVDKIAFTGSVQTGRKIMELAAQSNLKKVTLELGGKSPLIVFADADIDVAVEIAHQGLFMHQGQVCVASSRLFVEESIYEEFVKKSTERAKKRTIGSPQEMANETGPVVDKLQFDKILNYIERGKVEGAKLATGGCRYGDKGYFVEPTVFFDVNDDMTIAKEEIFGPVMSILVFKDINEVIQRANNTTFGLAAACITKDVKKAHVVSSKLKAGTVWVNTYGMITHRVPFGGFKQSGVGRELGEEGIREYLQTKTVCISLK